MIHTVRALTLSGVAGGNNGAGNVAGPTAGMALTSAPHCMQNLCWSCAAWPHCGQKRTCCHFSKGVVAYCYLGGMKSMGSKTALSA